ncbi:MAG TPA: PAS domain S-box protein [Ktedonobacteraceae bacterium]|nr:PAS domain S-box protein [Ktedonobacteraceae bacterium]
MLQNTNIRVAQLNRQESLIRLQAALIEQSHEAIFVMDGQNRIISWNRGAEKLYGWSKQEAFGKTPRDLLETRDEPQPYAEVLERVAREGHWEGELIHTTRAGQQVVTECHIEVMKDGEGKIVAKLSNNRDITLRKQMEFERKTYTRLAIDVTGFGCWEVNLGTCKVEMTPEARKLFGFPLEAALDHETVLSRIHAEDREKVIEIFERLQVARDADYVFEMRVIWPDQSVHWLAKRGRSFVDENDHSVHVVGVVVDISERIHMLEEIEQTNRRAKEALNSVSDTFVYLDRNWHFIYANERALECTGKTLKEAHSKTFWELFPDSVNTTLEESFRRAMVTGEEMHFEDYCAAHDKWYSWNVYPVHDGLIISYHDITERKIIEMALQASESKFRRLVESNIIGVYISDTQTRIWEANKAFLDTIGYSASDFIPGELKAEDLIVGYGDETTKRVEKEMKENGVVTVYEREFRTRQGDTLPVLLAGARLNGCDRAIFFVMNITAQKDLERQRDAFMSMTSHELRNPLAAIKGNLQLAQRRLVQLKKVTETLPGETESNLRKLDESVGRALNQTNVEDRLIGDLLDISRAASHRLKLYPRLCNLVEVVYATVEDLQSSFPHCTLIVDAPGQDELLVMADVDRIAQVINNYVTNALKYAGYEKPVRVHLGVDDGHARVSVIDQGPGLTLEDRQRIWERFYQVKGAKSYGNVGMGLGLGLHISQILIALHDGQVGVESVPGEGSTFWFTLPLFSSD